MALELIFWIFKARKVWNPKMNETMIIFLQKNDGGLRLARLWMIRSSSLLLFSACVMVKTPVGKTNTLWCLIWNFEPRIACPV